MLTPQFILPISDEIEVDLFTGGDGTIVYAADGWAVCSATVFHGRQAGPEVAKENARRIAACWNASLGLSTEQLETCTSLGERIVEFRRVGSTGSAT